MKKKINTNQIIHQVRKFLVSYYQDYNNNKIFNTKFEYYIVLNQSTLIVAHITILNDPNKIVVRQTETINDSFDEFLSEQLYNFLSQFIITHKLNDTINLVMNFDYETAFEIQFDIERIKEQFVSIVNTNEHIQHTLVEKNSDILYDIIKQCPEGVSLTVLTQKLKNMKQHERKEIIKTLLSNKNVITEIMNTNRRPKTIFKVMPEN